MSRTNRLEWLVWATVLPGMSGCQGAFGPDRLPDDPLFARRAPIEAKAEYALPVPVAYFEPTAPASPQFVNNTSDRRLVPAIPTHRSTQPQRDTGSYDN